MALLLGFLSGFFIFVVISVTTPLSYLLNTMGYPNVVIGIMMTVLAFHGLCSFLWGLWFRCSRRQFRLLAKYTLVFDVGLSLGFAGYNYIIYIAVGGMLSNPRSPVIFVVSGMNLLLIGFVWLLRKFFGQRVSWWFRIKYVPDNVTLELTSNSLKRAEYQLTQKNYKGAAGAFHAAAVMFLRLEDWSKTAQNYWMAAETLSREPNPEFDFDVAWLYALSSSAYLLSDDTEKAGKALELGKEALKDGKIAKKAEEKISLIIDFLVAIITKNTQQANEIWPNINRRLRRWGYTVIEETELLLEKVYNTVN
jgi:hypothetical protein